MFGSSLQRRLLTGFILGPITLLLIWFGGVFFLAGVGVAFYLSVFEWYKMAKQSDEENRDFLVGAIYIVLAFVSFIYIRLNFGEAGAHLVLALILSVWACDVGAYFSGKLIGGAKLAPKISPNKTWAGLIGGVTCSAVAFGLYVSATFSIQFLVIPIWLACVFGAGIGLVGQAGDLLVSWYKRRIKVKDTGGIIPGHGGILDRIDSLMLIID